MRSIRSWLGAVAAASLLFAGGVAAQSHTVYLDLDSNAATGCSVSTAAGAVAGVEARLTGTVTGQPPMVTAVSRELCAGGVFGAPQAQAANTPVGLNNGTGGADVIELSTSLTGLGPGGPARLVFVSSTASGADLVTVNGFIIPGPAPVPSQPAIIPATGLLALLLLAGLMVWLVRRHPGFGSSVALLLLLGAGVVWAANFVTDGAVADWAGVTPTADAGNDASSGEDTIELVAVFAATEGGNLFVRFDVLDAQNQPPVANAQAVTLAEEGQLVITLTGSDAEAAPLTFAIATPPTRGTLSAITPVNATSAQVTYTGGLNQEGADSFTFTVNDGSSSSTPATVGVTLTPVNDAPVVNALAFTVVENSPNGNVVGSATATDPDAGQTLSWQITAGNTNNAFAIDAATGQITVASAADVTGGPFALTVQAMDDSGAGNATGSATVTVSVTGVNDAPSFTGGPDQAALEDDPAVSVPGWATAISAGPADEAGQALAFNVSNDNNALFSVQPAIAPDGTLSYQLAPNANGAATVSVTLQDDGGTAGGGVDTSSPPDTFTITVTAVNDAPSFVAGPDQTAFQTDGPLTIDPWATALSAGPADESGQALSFSIDSNDAPALFTTPPAISPSGALSFDPAPGQVGVATLTVRITDTGGTANGGVDSSATQTVTITVTDVNDAPSFLLAGNPSPMLEDAGPQTVAGFASNLQDNDPGTQALTFTVTQTGGSLGFAAPPAIDGSTGDLTYTAAPNANGSATFEVVLMDDGGTANGGVDTSGAQSFTVTVDAVNDAPSFSVPATAPAVNENAGAQALANFASALSTGPADEAGQALTGFSVTVTGTTGGLSFSSAPAIDLAGQLTYAAAADSNGTATVEVTLTDDGGTAGGGVDTSAAQTFTITVNSVNSEPTFDALADPAASLEDGGAQSVPGFATGMSQGTGDSGQVLSFVLSPSGSTGTLAFASGPAIDASTGALSYTAAPDTNGTATFSVVLTDDGGTANGGDDTSAAQSFTISVTAVNDVPGFTAGPDVGVLEDSGAASFPAWATGMSAGPVDESGQILAFVVAGNTNPALFSVAPAVDAASGELTFTVANGQVGSADITLTLFDSGGTANGGVDTSAGQTFTISVNNLNDAPSFMLSAASHASFEDGGAQTAAGFATAMDDSDPVVQALTFNVTGNTNPALFAVPPAIDATTGDLTYTAAANANGSATITVVLMDDGGTASGGSDTSAPQNFDIVVTAVNDAPSFSVPANAPAVNENAGPQSVPGFAGGASTGPANESGQALVAYAATVTGTTGTLAFATAPAIDVASGTLTYTAAPNAEGTATVQVTLSDNGGTANGGADTSAAQTFTITVNGVNSEPTFTLAGNPPASNEDAGLQTVAGFASAIDAGAGEGGQTLTFNVTQTGGTLGFAAAPAIDSVSGNLTYTAAANASGSATFDVVLTDNGGTANGGDDTSGTQSFTITVNPVNDAPSFSAGAAQSVLEDSAAQSVPGWATGMSAGPADEAGQTLGFQVSNDNNALFSVQPAVDAAGQLTYTPAANASGVANVTVALMDDGGTANGGVDTSAGQNVTITITGVNDAPSFTAGGDVTVAEDSGAFSATWATAVTDGDPEVQALTFLVGNNNPTLFSVAPAIAPDGTLSFTPALNAFGSAQVTVQLTDDGGTANGGIDATAPVNFTLTVSPVNDPPVAGDEAFQTYGNTELRLDLAAVGTPHVLDTTGSATGVRHNDMDPVESHPHSVVGIAGCGDTTAPFDCPLGSGARVVMESDGRFAYTPGPGDASDSFQYVLEDQPPVGEGTPAQDTGTVSLTMVEMVWYVNGSAAAGGNGTSTAPLQDFAGINGAGGAGDNDDADDWIYVHNSTVSGGIELEAGQRLLGEAVALNLGAAVNGDPLVDLRAAGSRPTVNNAAGNAVTIGNALPREVRGLTLQGSVNAIDLTTTAALTGATALLIDNNVINGAGAEGIDVNFNTTTTGRTVTISNNSWNNAGTHTGNAIDVANTNATAGTLRLTLNGNTNIESAASAIFVNGGAAVGPTVIESLADNTVHGDTGLFGMNLQRVIFDASTAGGFQTVSGGTTDIGTAANRVGTSGLRLEDVRGDLSFTSLDIFAGNGTGLFATSTGAFNGPAATGFRLANTSTVDTLLANGGPGANLSSTTTALDWGTYTVTGSSATGLNLDGVAGTFHARAGSIATPTAAGGTVFRVNNSSVVSNFDASLAATQGTGVNLTNNSGTITFRGGMSLSTAANPAFVATGGGTVHVCDENPCNAGATGGLVNTLATTTATALNVANTSIGAGGLEFRSISAGTAASGPSSGIILNATGGAGGLKVKGTGGAGSGGLIQRATGAGVVLTDTAAVALASFGVQNGADDGIRGSNVAGFSLTAGVVTDNGDVVGERGIEITNLTGSGAISGSNVSGNAEDNIFVRNTGGTLNPLTISGTGGVGSTCQINSTSVAVGNDGILVLGEGGANIVMSVTGCRFDQNKGDHIQVATDAVAAGTVIDATISNNTMTAVPANLGGGVTVSPSGNVQMDFDIASNNIQGAVDDGTNINMGTASTPASGLRGNIASNTIGTAGVVDSGSLTSNTVTVATNRGGTTTVAIQNNALRQYSNLAGIDLAARDAMGTTSGALNATVTGNTVANPGTFASNGLTVSSGATAGDNYEVCLDIGGAGALANTVNGSGANGGTDLRVRHRFAATVFLRGYTGALTDTTAVGAYLSGRNVVVPTASAAVNTTAPVGGQFQNTPGSGACALP